jgi:sugar lactone lactonase YvrE
MNMKPPAPFRDLYYLLLTCLLLSVLLLSGCASDQTCRYISKTPIFFPPPPDEPRIQYLTGINSTDDIGETEKQSTLSLVVTGKEQPDILKKIGKAFGIVPYKGKIYVAEGLTRRITIISPMSGTIETPGGANTPKGSLSYPVNLTLDDDGNLYVADTARREIVVYDSAGNFKTSFGKGIDPKSKITDVKIYKGKLFALDMGTNRVRVLDRMTGEQLNEFGGSDKAEQGLRLPGNFTIDPDGNLYITNIGSNMVIKLDQDGNFLGSFGGIGDQFGQFSKPKGVAVDKDKRIYVVDGGTNVVQLFDDQFRLLTYFGWPGLPFGSLNGPAGIAVSTENIEFFQKFAAPGFKLESLIYVVSQFGQEFCIPRISIYGLGQMEKKEGK